MRISDWSSDVCSSDLLCSSVMSALVEQIKRLTLCLLRFKHFRTICFLSRPAVTKMMTLILSTSILAACAGQSREQIMPTPQSAEAERLAPQIGTFGFDEGGMNRTVAPGDDFYEYANGTWAKTTPIPADKSNYGMFTVLEDLSKKRTQEILEAAEKDPNSKIEIGRATV